MLTETQGSRWGVSHYYCFQQNDPFHCLCVNCDIWHEICFNMHYVFILLNLYFCRYQNCVYTYRILPNEDKKLSVQVRKSQIWKWQWLLTSVENILHWFFWVEASCNGSTFIFAQAGVVCAGGLFWDVHRDTSACDFEKYSKVTRMAFSSFFLFLFSKSKAFGRPQKNLDTLISHKISFIRYKILNTGICKHLEISLELTFHILFCWISSEPQVRHIIYTTGTCSMTSILNYILFIKLLNILVSNSEAFSVNCFAQEKCLFFIVQYFYPL